MNKEPIQKEEVKTATEMEGMHHSDVYGECLNYEGVAYIIKTPTPSDTFINENKLRDEWLNYIYNELFPGMSLISKETIATWWIDKLKSSLQKQRQSILEEIEKKTNKE